MNLEHLGEFVLSQMDNVYGYPTTDQRTLKFYGNFCLQYSNERRNPIFTFEFFEADNFPSGKRESNFSRKPGFFIDETLSKEFGRSEKELKKGFKRKGYAGDNLSLGHLAARKNHTDSKENYKATYIMSNIIPQDEVMNQGIWNSVEDLLFSLFKDNNKNYKSVAIFTGPVYFDHDL